MRDVKPSAGALRPSGFRVLNVSRAHHGFEPAPSPITLPTKVLPMTAAGAEPLARKKTTALTPPGPDGLKWARR